MKRKKALTAIIIVILLAVIILVAMILKSQHGEEKVQYTNLFEYAIDMNDEDYAYTPKGLAYGMSKDEVLQAEELTEYDVNEWGNISYTKNLSGLSDGIGEVKFTKTYIFAEDKGSDLVRVQCAFIANADDAVELLEMLSEQAKDYMPQPQQGTIPGIKAGEYIEWSDSITSAVRFNADTDVNAGKTVIILNVEAVTIAE